MEHETETTMLGASPAFGTMLEQVSRLAPLDRPALIIGERGTGKELVAARLHYLSPRWEQPLVKLNCAALTESLLESELFGHEAGAFTGATKRHVGRFERADGGSLFLDELGTLPARMQEKILRVIEYGEFERVGGSQTLRVNVRIVGATNENLPALAHEGRFRADLLDRLAFDVVHVPPLRARPEDILELAQHFAIAFTAELKRPYFPGFGEGALDALLAWPWPGNVRELKNAVERSIYRAPEPDQVVDEIHFDPFAHAHATVPEGAMPGAVEPDATPGISPLPVDFRRVVDGFETRLLTRALAAADGNRRIAADSLALSYDQLRGLLRKHGIGGPGRAGRPAGPA
jgi:psp operon transcriptional activator